MDPDQARQQLREARFAEEAAVVRQRLDQVGLDAEARRRIGARAVGLVETLRRDPSLDLMEAFLAEYGLSTDEGVALMCLAEAYLRVPDAPTLDALIRDKIGGADWSQHRGDAESLLINASTWALMLTGRLYREDPPLEQRVVGQLKQLLQRVGEPVVRRAVAEAMKVMGRQFVLGRDIDEALDNAREMERRGCRYSYDMLGEAARTEEDARRYFRAYSRAITALGERAEHVDAHANPGISIKLSALHPRYEQVQLERVMDELVPRITALVVQARNANIGLNIDAEEADRLDLSLTVFENVLANRDLRGWDGFGLVVQAYAKSCLPVLEWIHALADALDRRVAVRLVKGAYWDFEIKHAQLQGLPTYPVFTRKASTDVSYLAGARYLLDHADRLYPQFATHNAHTVAAVLEMAGDLDRYEFQRLHGMGEGLHELVRRETGRAPRIYAPVGIHEDLLAYLVRRLLENGANSSFVNQLLDVEVPAEILVRDPVATVEGLDTLPHPRIPLPPDLYGGSRRNARGWNLNDPLTAAELETAMRPHRTTHWHAAPCIAGDTPNGSARPVHDPADRREVVGDVVMGDAATVDAALSAASRAFPAWRDLPVDERASLLERIADLYEAHAPELMALLTREAGKTRLDGVLEVREAVDFCRYYAAEARRTLADGQRLGRGPFVCISPWNFPLAIYTGQVVAALVAGNSVIAKPAEQTSLIGARAHALMLEAGVPAEVLAFVPGEGATVGAALTGDPRVAGVCFTGSTDTAILIDRALAAGAGPGAPLIAETGGLNAMLVDSTALPEAAVRDIVASAFQSAGQRCSALRALFVQKEVASKLLTMLEGATRELGIGNPWNPAIDVGPVIDAEAHRTITAHCGLFAERGRELFHCAPPRDTGDGLFVAPTALRLERLDELEREIFGPVLHVLEFDAGRIDDVVAQVNTSGYGLTFGIHSRLDDRVEAICRQVRVGNIYVNRNQIGAVVGVQPFGGEGLSGTGPKAGGPHYLARFTTARDPGPRPSNAVTGAPAGLDGIAADDFAQRAVALQPAWDLAPDRMARLAAAAGAIAAPLGEAVQDAVTTAESWAHSTTVLEGPTGERNTLALHGRGIALCLGGTGGAACLARQAILALAAGNAVALAGPDAVPVAAALLPELERAGVPSGLLAPLIEDAAAAAGALPELGVAVFDGDATQATAVRTALAGRDGRRVPQITLVENVDMLVTERVISIDTTASGGNASLLTLSEG